MTGSELGDLFAVFAPEDWRAFGSGLEETHLRYACLRRRAAFELFWMEVEQLVHELASRRLERQATELIELMIAEAPAP